MQVERGPKLRDMSRPGGGVGVQIRVSEASEVLMSMCVLSGDEEPHSFDLGGEAIERIAAGVTPRTRAIFDQVVAGREKVPGHLLGMVLDCPRPLDFECFMNTFSQTPPVDVMRHLLGEFMPGYRSAEPELIHRAARGEPGAGDELIEQHEQWPEWQEIMSRLLGLGAERVKELLGELFPDWYEQVFSPLAGEVMPRLEAERDAAQALVGEMPLPQLVQTLTSGVVFSPTPEIRRVVLFPTAWMSPWVLLSEHRDARIYCFPVRERAPGDADVPSADLVRLYKALGDEGRLRLLRRLRRGPMTLKEAAEELGVAKSTAHHHMAILRQAGLILARGDQDSTYSLRDEPLPDVNAALQRFLDA